VNNIIDLWVLMGIFWVINPYQASYGAIIMMPGAKQSPTIWREHTLGSVISMGY